ncbi:MAG: aldehyde dehydrogenase family protein [Thermomicrobiales bacterium]
MAAAAPKITYTATPDQIAAMHESIDTELDAAEKTFNTQYPMIIHGEDRTSDKVFEVVAPADVNLVLGFFPKGTQADVDEAVAAAKAYYPTWSKKPWQERVAIIRKAAEVVRERKFRLTAVMIRECGKSRTEAIGEVEEVADLFEEYANQLEAADGYTLKMDSLDPREQNVSVLKPFGVWAILSPFNFPTALAGGPISAALLAGNTVVFKPASATAISGYELVRAMHDAGVPVEALQFVTGGGGEVGDYLVHHKDIGGVVFTGSKEVGMEVYTTFAKDYPKPVITEMGGKNPAIVTKHADLKKAIEGVARSAFGFSGQKCSACSRVYVAREVYDEFIDGLVKRADTMVIGDPTDKEVFVGPVIDGSAVARFEEAAALAAKDGHIRFGGNRIADGDLARGTFVAPTIVDGLPLDHELFKRELFLPFVVVGAVDSLEQALQEANDTEYGLTAGIFTEDEDEIEQFFDTIEAGVVYANRAGGATTGAWPSCQPFCGWKGSGSSGKGALGHRYVPLFLREQGRCVVVEG